MLCGCLKEEAVGWETHCCGLLGFSREPFAFGRLRLLCAELLNFTTSVILESSLVATYTPLSRFCSSSNWSKLFAWNPLDVMWMLRSDTGGLRLFLRRQGRSRRHLGLPCGGRLQHPNSSGSRGRPTFRLLSIECLKYFG